MCELLRHKCARLGYMFFHGPSKDLPSKTLQRSAHFCFKYASLSASKEKSTHVLLKSK